MQNPTFQASNKRGLVQRMLSDGADTFAKKVRWVKKHIPFIERPEGFVAWATRGEKRPRRNPVRLKGGEETLAFARAVADAYAAAPLYDQEAIPSYEALAKSIEKTFKQLQSKVDVRFVEGQPYSNEKEMADAVKKTGILYISTDFNEHPFFTPEQNLKFRAVHDWYTHIATGSEFSQRGEIKAYNNQAKVTPRAALPALFTEVVGQAMYATVHGDFPEQKVAILKGFDYYNVGEGPAAPKKASMKTPAKKAPKKSRNPTAATHVKRGAEHLEAAEELFFSGSKSARGPAANMRRADMIAALEHAAMGKQDLMDGGDKARVIEANGIIEAVSERLQLAPARKNPKGHNYMVKNAKGVAVYLTTTLAEARKVVPKGGCIEKL